MSKNLFDRTPVVECDMAQIEARVLASMTGPQVGDLHKNRAAEIFRVKPEHVTPEMRRFAKLDTFRGLYGGPSMLPLFPLRHPAWAEETQPIIRLTRWQKLGVRWQNFWDRLATMLARIGI
jgi:hypothetical protein